MKVASEKVTSYLQGKTIRMTSVNPEPASRKNTLPSQMKKIRICCQLTYLKKRIKVLNRKEMKIGYLEHQERGKTDNNKYE